MHLHFCGTISLRQSTLFAVFRRHAIRIYGARVRPWHVRLWRGRGRLWRLLLLLKRRLVRLQLLHRRWAVHFHFLGTMSLRQPTLFAMFRWHPIRVYAARVRPWHVRLWRGRLWRLLLLLTRGQVRLLHRRWAVHFHFLDTISLRQSTLFAVFRRHAIRIYGARVRPDEQQDYRITQQDEQILPLLPLLVLDERRGVAEITAISATPRRSHCGKINGSRHSQ